MTATVTLAAISKDFGTGSAALDGVHLDILAGTCTALLGPSGSGKSTILRIIAGLEHPSDGTVIVDGRDITAALPEDRGIGLVSQRPLLFPHLSVVDNVAFADRVAGRSRRLARARALPFLELVQVPELAARAPSTLSGGQQQRVAIARALAAHPTILLLDEPFSALDPALRDDMHALLREIRRTLAPTIVIVTHDRDEAATVADRIAVIERGRLLQHDTVEQLYTRPRSRAVADIMGTRTQVAGVVRAGEHLSPLGSVPVDRDTPEGPGFLIMRHEVVTVTATDGRGGDAGVLVRGIVGEVRREGARRSVRIHVGGEELHAELSPGAVVVEGDEVSAVIPPGVGCVVPE